MFKKSKIDESSSVAGGGHTAFSSSKRPKSMPPPSSKLMEGIRFALEGVLVATIAHCGITGNLVSMVILIKKKLDLQPFLCRLLVLLVVFDTVFLAADFLTYSLPVLSDSYNDYLNPILAPRLLIPLTQIALTGSVYTTVAITVERYVSCCWPHVPPREGRWVNVASIAGIVLFAVGYNISRFLEYEAEPGGSHANITRGSLEELIQAHGDAARAREQLVIGKTELRNDTVYIRCYMMAANCTVMVIVPLVSLVILNWKIHGAIRERERFRATMTSTSLLRCKSSDESEEATRTRHNKEREVTISQILIAIVAMFFICHTFKVVVVGYEVITYFYSGSLKNEFPDWVEIVINLNHVALAFNAAINIVIYIYKDKKFRSACLDMIPFIGYCQLTEDVVQQDTGPQANTNSTDSMMHSCGSNFNRIQGLSPKSDVMMDMNRGSQAESLAGTLQQQQQQYEQSCGKGTMTTTFINPLVCLEERDMLNEPERLSNLS